MKKYYFFICMGVLLHPFSLSAQTWQWAKGGGGEGSLLNPESVVDIATDADGNVTIISPVDKTNLMIDGHPRTAWGFNQQTPNYIIAQFSCNGTYRWSKVIGSNQTSIISGIETDAQGNVYAVGKTVPDADFAGFVEPIHFDPDFVEPLTCAFGSCQTVKKSLFIIKYDKNGVFQWYHRPQADGLTDTQNAGNFSIDLQVDPLGNSYWLVLIKPGTFANGAFVNTLPGQNCFLFKYDAAGTFLGANQIAYVAPLNDDPAGLTVARFRRNHNTGTIFMVGSDHDEPITTIQTTINGQFQAKDKYLAAFDSNGVFLWKKEGSGILNDGDYHRDICFDSDNNIYYTADVTQGATFSNSTPFTTFNCYAVMKLDPTGNVLWQTAPLVAGYALHARSVGINGNELGNVSAINGFTWGGVTVPNVPGEGYKPFLARLNKDTGAVINVHKLSSYFGVNDYADVVTARNGNFYVGGNFGDQLVAGSTTLTGAGESNFFVAKFGTASCTLGLEDKQELEGLQLFPNPVHNVLFVKNQATALKYTLYDLMGKKLETGTIPVLQGEIRFLNYPAGTYLLYLEDTNGYLRKVKIIKEM